MKALLAVVAAMLLSLPALGRDDGRVADQDDQNEHTPVITRADADFGADIIFIHAGASGLPARRW
jgi:hypothetical protein